LLFLSIPGRITEHEQNERLRITLLKIIFIGNLVSISLIPSFIGQDSAKLLKWKEISRSFKLVVQSFLITRISGFLGVIICGTLCIPKLFLYNTSFVNSNLIKFEFFNFNISIISVTFFYATAIFGFFMETYQQFIPLKTKT